MKASRCWTRHWRSRTSTPTDLVVAAYIAGQQVPVSEAERNAAVRRALFVFAAGGDVRRDPTLADPAVVELAADLDSRERRAALLEASPELRALDDPDVAWRAYACGLLAEALGEEEDDMSETRFNGELEEPGDKDLPDEGEPWAKTSSGDADDITSDDDDND